MGPRGAKHSVLWPESMTMSMDSVDSGICASEETVPRTVHRNTKQLSASKRMMSSLEDGTGRPLPVDDSERTKRCHGGMRSGVTSQAPQGCEDTCDDNIMVVQIDCSFLEAQLSKLLGRL
jgi:hypothetical protein